MKLFNAKKKLPLYGGLAIGLCALPFLVLLVAGNQYPILILCISLIYIMAVTGLDILFGYSGQISLGHAAFFTIGAYTTGLLNIYFNMPLILTIPIATIFSAAMGALLAYPASKLKFHFLSLATVAFGEITYYFLYKSPGGFSFDFKGINVVGIADSRHYLLNRDGLSLSDYRSQLKTASTQGSIRDFVRAIIETNIFNSVFVDCTASADVASVYRDLLQHNISVVAANKLAASSDYKSYTELKEVARQRDVKFLFETNVGAGLPIINTMGDLIHSGDRILRIEAVLSGTLNFIFNTLSKEVPLSKAISMAKEAGYSEPDPRIDLSGTDVIRKIVILAREAGYQVEQSDVKTNLFIPNDYFAGSLEEFWQRIPALDEQFESDRKQLEKENKRWRFVAKMDKGEVSVQLTTVDNTHPFYHLEGSNNIILLTTERYHEYPLLIQGYGRVIRSETDTGVVAILDCRAGDSGAYCDYILAALPSQPVTSSIVTVHKFYHDVKPEVYFNFPTNHNPNELMEDHYEEQIA